MTTQKYINNELLNIYEDESTLNIGIRIPLETPFIDADGDYVYDEHHEIQFNSDLKVKTNLNEVGFMQAECILELGSGVGLCGAVCGILCRGVVYVTGKNIRIFGLDTREVIENCKSNLSAYKNVVAKCLDWVQSFLSNSLTGAGSMDDISEDDLRYILHSNYTAIVASDSIHM
ncbi:hypothetical protein O9G_001099 [Rozella allomycis CSF55]|uniref:Uncharacterized protein n=1 Tax=Rozella allomycis (strain CSF55) TaxID=988480 RepID=A0A075ARP5_ROZAC|nr:hypothetical protein O9G_001099 [Rozella allomycis CSF55]|eukprot:EPZ31187.1 hypothetical protein O9G_001099 [Rozella allomycis CSF55]